MGRNRGMFSGCGAHRRSLLNPHTFPSIASLCDLWIQDLQRPIVLHPRIWAVLCQIAKEKVGVRPGPVPGQKYTGCLTQIVQAW